MRKLIVIDHENIFKVFGHIVGLRLDHFILLEYMTKFALSNAKVISSEGINYYWVAHAKAISDMPLVFTTWKDGKRVDCSKRTLRRITSDLEKAGLIYKYKDCQKESKSYYGFSDTVISFFSPHVKPRTKNSEGVDINNLGARSTVATNSKLLDSKLKDSIYKGHESSQSSHMSHIFDSINSVYLQRFKQLPSKDWLKKRENELGKDVVLSIFSAIEDQCVKMDKPSSIHAEDKGFINLASKFKTFHKYYVSDVVTNAFTKFFKSKGLDIDASKSSLSDQKKMSNIVKQLEEKYNKKFNEDRVFNFLCMVKKELWYNNSTDLYTVAFLNNNIQQAIATLPKKKKATPRKKSLQVNKFVSTFVEEVNMDKHLDLEEKHVRHNVRQNLSFLVSALGAANFTSIEQVKSIYSKFLHAYVNGKYESKEQALKALTKK